MAIPVLWPEPCWKWVRWTEEKKHQYGAGNLKGLEWFWMKEWSLISCQEFSNLIRHYRKTFRASVFLYFLIWDILLIIISRGANNCVQRVFEKKHLFNNDISRESKDKKLLTMQINFHSLLWSYLPRVPIFLAMTVWFFFIKYWTCRTCS